MYVPPLLLAAVGHRPARRSATRLPFAAPLRSLELIQQVGATSHFAIYFTLAVVALAYTYRTAAAVGKKQIKWIYLGMVLGFLPFLVVYIVPYLVYRLGQADLHDDLHPAAGVDPAGLRGLDPQVQAVGRRGRDQRVLAYSVTFIFGMIAFSTVNLSSRTSSKSAPRMERNFLAFTSGLLIAGVLIPVKGRIESVIEMFVYRDQLPAPPRHDRVRAGAGHVPRRARADLDDARASARRARHRRR